MTPRRMDFSDVRLYAVTPDVKDGVDMLLMIRKVLAGGVDAVQLRSRSLPDREMVALGQKIKEACVKANALFIVDNRADLALAVNADGVHVGHTDLPISAIRAMIGYHRIIGSSTHSLAQALEAQKAGADYVSCGPLWATPTKPETPAVGPGLIHLYKAALRVPFVAIGGIDESNIDQVVRAGATSIAVVRAFFESKDPEKTVHRFLEKLHSEKVEVGL